MTQPTWTILVATLSQRADRLRRLLDQLGPQLNAADGRVVLSALYNHGERPLGHVRYDLLAHATTPYVSFVDDDDELPSYHVAEVLRRLDEGVDYVGWQMQTYVDDVPLKPTYHSLRYDHWWEDQHGYYRDVSHLNPIRTELARRGDFRRGDPPEDTSWADQIRTYVGGATEAYVDKIMYHYRSKSSDTTWRGVGVARAPYDRPMLNHPHVSYHPASSE